MANPVKGEVSFDALGQTWTGVLSTNARCEIEEAFGRGFAGLVMDAFGEGASDERLTPEQMADPEAVRAAALDRATRMNIRYVRGFLFHAIRQYHPAVSANEAGFIIDEIGMGRAFELVSAMINRTEPPAEAGAEGKAPPAPKRKN